MSNLGEIIGGVANKYVSPQAGQIIDSAYKAFLTSRGSAVNNSTKSVGGQSSMQPAQPTQPTYQKPDPQPPSMMRIPDPSLGTYKKNQAAGEAAIAQAKQMWEYANQKGDQAGMDEAHAWAEAVRRDMGIGSYANQTGQTDQVDQDPMDYLTQIKQAQSELAKQRTSAFDKLFGTESRISQFYAPQIKAIEEQLIDVEGLLSKLRPKMEEAYKGVGKSEGGLDILETRERGKLTDQYSDLLRNKARLETGLETQMKLSEKEYDLLTKNAEDVYALEYEKLKGIKDKNEALEKGVETALSDIQEFVISAGVIPSENFQNVINNAMQQINEGKSLAEIKYGMLRAVGMNPQVKKYVEMAFRKAENALKTKSSSGPGGFKLPSSLHTKAYVKYGTIDNLTPEQVKVIDAEKNEDWKSKAREALGITEEINEESKEINEESKEIG